MKCGTFKKLDIFKDLYKSFSDLLNCENFKDFAKWQEEKQEQDAKLNFYKYAFECGALSQKLGTYGQYEKTETGYKMKDKYFNDPFYKNYNYILEF